MNGAASTHTCPTVAPQVSCGLSKSLCLLSCVAYMLFYRRTDAARNEKFLKEDEMPPHVQVVLERVKEEQHKLAKKREVGTELLTFYQLTTW